MVRSIIHQILKNSHYFYYRFKHLFNYIIIGFFSVLLEVLIVKFSALSGVPFLLRISVGFLAGVFLSFILNAKLNFKVPSSKNAKTFSIFLIISTVALFVNFILMELLSKVIILDYSRLRFLTAGCVFIVTYITHRKITFNFVKKVGVAVYVNASESVPYVYSKIKYYADFIHIDLVDKTMNSDASAVDLSIIKSIDKTWGLEKMIHIMSKNPLKWIKLIYPSVKTIIIHLSINESLSEIINFCKAHRKKVGIALTINDNTDLIKPYLRKIDYIQVMGIKEVGKSGQLFDPDSIKLLHKIKNIQKNYKFKVIFDGGVKPTNISQINADYIVSASSLLKSQDPIKSFMELKTSARYNDISLALRSSIINGVKEISQKLAYIESTTIVGTFAEGKKLEGISDIDTVIITDSLSKKKFNEIINEFEKLKNDIASKFGYSVFVNNTFGPLKFNDNNIVFHVMIYDKKSHIEHCRKSPFTCLDWQLSNLYFKKKMKDIYEVTHLQPNYFFNARRSVSEYLSELKEGEVSYRYYSFNKKGEPIENKAFKKMRTRGKVEYAYHIMKFIMINFMKLYYQKNKRLSIAETAKSYFHIFPKNRKMHELFLKKIISSRESGKFNEEELFSGLERFLLDFQSQFKEYFEKEAITLYTMRHAETQGNKQLLFLGQKSDLSINKVSKNKLKELKIPAYDLVISSPLKRCTQTLRLFTQENPIIDKRLLEINYGLLDGQNISKAKESHKYLFDLWAQGHDPKFPQGENTRDVLLRIISFIGDLIKYKGRKILLCTHNVVLRTIIGYSIKIPMKDWYKIKIDHLKPIKFIVTKNNKVYLDVDPKDLENIYEVKNG